MSKLPNIVDSLEVTQPGVIDIGEWRYNYILQKDARRLLGKIHDYLENHPDASILCSSNGEKVFSLEFLDVKFFVKFRPHTVHDGFTVAKIHTVHKEPWMLYMGFREVLRSLEGFILNNSITTSMEMYEKDALWVCKTHDAAAQALAAIHSSSLYNAIQRGYLTQSASESGYVMSIDDPGNDELYWNLYTKEEYYAKRAKAAFRQIQFLSDIALDIANVKPGGALSSDTETNV